MDKLTNFFKSKLSVMKKARILFGVVLVALVIVLGSVPLAESAPNTYVTCYEVLETCPNSPSFDVYFCGSCSVKMATSYSGPKRCFHKIGVNNPNLD